VFGVRYSKKGYNTNTMINKIIAHYKITSKLGEGGWFSADLVNLLRFIMTRLGKGLPNAGRLH